MYIYMYIYMYIVLWIKIDVTDNSIQLIFKFNQYKNAYIFKFVYFGETRRKIQLYILCSKLNSRTKI